MDPRRSALAVAFTALAVGALLAVPPLSRSGGRIGEVLGLESFLALLALAFAVRSPRGIRARLALGPSALSRGALALLVLGTLGLSNALDGAYRIIERPDSGVLFEFDSELAGIRGGALASALVTFALIPGIAEELLFRGLLQPGLQARFGPIAGIALASVLFGALHLDPAHSTLAAILGLYLGVIAYLARSVRASIACHVANNAAAVLGAALAATGEPMPLPLPAVAAAFSLGVLGWSWRRYQPPDVSEIRPAGGQPGLQK